MQYIKVILPKQSKERKKVKKYFYFINFRRKNLNQSEKINSHNFL